MAKDEAPQWSTLRVELDDATEMAKLAKLEGGTIAEVYREVCAPVVRERLRARAAELAAKGA